MVYLLQSWDTAFEDHEKADPSACTTWGVFRNEETKRHEIILLGSWQKRLIFAELRPQANDLYDLWDTSACGPVDQVIIEPKATGKAIASELRRAGVPVHEFPMVRGDKGRELGRVAKAHPGSLVWHIGGSGTPHGYRAHSRSLIGAPASPAGLPKATLQTQSLWTWSGR